MKNKGLMISLIILLLVIIIGLVVFLVLCLNGGLNLTEIFKNKSSNIVFDETYEVKTISDLEILSNAGDVYFEESTDENIRIVVYGKNSNDLKVNQNEEKLEVDYSQHKYSWFGFISYTNDIIVYIPKDYSNDINITNNYGDCKISDLENATININASCGNIDLGTIKNATLKCEYGDINLENILNKCTIQAECGNIKINKLQIKENSLIKSEYGNVKIKETNDIYIDAKTELGNVNINTNNRNAEIILKIEAECGDIKVEN